MQRCHGSYRCSIGWSNKFLANSIVTRRSQSLAVAKGVVNSVPPKVRYAAAINRVCLLDGNLK